MATRKLQTEIERTLKKVTEGLDIFHETLDKLNTAATPNQKEKVEADLKKEIKKLQRLRDQIKGWQTLSEIKDKQALNDARKSIEAEMERFKLLEKEMKIKAYSKEGLNQTAKLDPKEREKLELVQWINTCVDRLNTQVDAFEAEVEALQLQARKTKRLESSKQERLDALASHVERHKYHVRRLELALRFLENDRLTPEQVALIKDDIEYYIEANEEADFVENDDVYAELNLDVADSDDSDVASSDTDELEAVPSRAQPSESPSPVPALAKKRTNEAVPTPNAPPTVSAHKPSPSTSNVPTRPTAIINSKPYGAGYPPKSPAVPMAFSTVSRPSSIASSASLNAPVAAVAPPKISGPSFASAASAAHHQTQAMSAPATIPAAAYAISASMSPSPPPVDTMASGLNSSSQAKRSALADDPSGYEELLALIQTQRTTPLEKQTFADLNALLEVSHANCPDGYEMERSKSFVPKQPVAVPSYYPTAPPAILDNPAIFERFELDTLFFIFYYQQKSYAQYLAARELKRQSWRFHKKYLTWFQRHEEPKKVTEEHEQGTYIYFDYEGSWCQRQKSEFTFEYRFLEDDDLV